MTYTIPVGSAKIPRNVHFIERPQFNEIEKMRQVYFIPNERWLSPIRIKDMTITQIYSVITKIKRNEVKETSHYSLPYLHYLLEAELKIRPILNSYIVEKIFNSLPESRATKDINQVIKPSKTAYYQKIIFYS